MLKKRTISMSQPKKLFSDGWCRVSGISSREDLLALAKSFGSPLRSPTGEYVKQLSIESKETGKKHTFTSTFGKGSFPLHTDTAFWKCPARFLVLRVMGDLRRPTTVMPFEKLFDSFGASIRRAAYRSVWRIRVNRTSYYDAMTLRAGNTEIWKFDPQCMYPANKHALDFLMAYRTAVTSGMYEEIHWSSNEAVILANWFSMHGRGNQPFGETLRLLQRIYVE
jgi:hypothetical protein